MKKRIIISLILGILFLAFLPTAGSAVPKGRKDPFRDLLAEQERKEKTKVSGTPQLSIEDVQITGIVKARGRFIAIVNGPQGFPYFIKKGDKFSDGYVYSINETQVIFKKIKERGIPLGKHKTVVKELFAEEH
ncbi:MAG: hypothetical protein ACE5LC_02355 [Candidatus Aminicenantales bacterium]